MNKVAALFLIGLLSDCSLGKKEKSEIVLPEIETMPAADSVLMEIPSMGVSPIASKLFYAIKKSGIIGVLLLTMVKV